MEVPNSMNKVDDTEPLGEKCHVLALAHVDTVGGLRKLLEKYDDSTSFGFRNQAIQTLYEVQWSGEELCLLFQ